MSPAIISLYLQTKDQLAAITREYKARVAKYDAAMERLTDVLDRILKHSGAKSLKTGTGTVYKAKAYYCSVADKSAFLEWIKTNDAFDLLTLQANKLAVKEYREQEQDLPPGLSWLEEDKVHVLRGKNYNEEKNDD
ncbi:MAG: hypothetical protein LBL72_06410 [Candidatus Accumulibacter sp.]|jgi:hypothetical protein|nr:hypothetical protein [Accumulibacter sp.]